MDYQTNTPKKSGCMGCLYVFLGLVLISLIAFFITIKYVLPKVTAEFIVTGMKSSGMTNSNLSEKDIDFAIKTLDKLDKNKMRDIMDTLSKRPITNSTEVVELVFNKLGIEGVSQTDRSQLASHLSADDVSNMMVYMKDNEFTSFMAIGMFKSSIKDTLIEIKKLQKKK